MHTHHVRLFLYKAVYKQSVASTPKCMLMRPGIGRNAYPARWVTLHNFYIGLPFLAGRCAWFIDCLCMEAMQTVVNQLLLNSYQH